MRSSIFVPSEAGRFSSLRSSIFGRPGVDRGVGPSGVGSSILLSGDVHGQDWLPRSRNGMSGVKIWCRKRSSSGHCGVDSGVSLSRIEDTKSPSLRRKILQIDGVHCGVGRAGAKRTVFCCLRRSASGISGVGGRVALSWIEWMASCCTERSVSGTR